ncbi:MAG: hypothetical protein GY719_30335 [bacterium]|nr:hypothetical protein [bacterium]
MPGAPQLPGDRRRQPALIDVLAQVKTIAPADSTVLILGEAGTGKELSLQPSMSFTTSMIQERSLGGHPRALEPGWTLHLLDGMLGRVENDPLGRLPKH